MQCILIVEDEKRLAAILADYLQAAGFSVRLLADGSSVVSRVRQEQPDLILLDLMLPGRDGMDICREIRSFSAVPIIMVTARIEEIDRLLGLELGADDYICKPFSPREVVARVKAVLRRANGTVAPSHGLVLDESTMRAGLDGCSLDLTAVEFKLLAMLQARPGHIYSRDQLMGRIYPDQRIVNDRTIDSHIKKLRRKMQQAAPGRDLIRSVYGVGYTFDPDQG
ncbi:response regulator [Desulfobulbus alkaliphilus]|uniref:response regulator n=1 Tax=Desulfobulbus alkaliphilus TaxID=869814 RepID=UPI00196692DC|nr:response regulator [Desulfobulbus alkaliphilus]MBM9537128.1 response regulator [Desulfobulbus alkaliphilus]